MTGSTPGRRNFAPRGNPAAPFSKLACGMDQHRLRTYGQVSGRVCESLSDLDNRTLVSEHTFAADFAWIEGFWCSVFVIA